MNHVSKLEVEGLIKFEWTDSIYKKMVEEEENRFFFGKDI